MDPTAQPTPAATSPDSDDVQAALKRFVYDNPDLERLEALLDDFNPFAALRWTHQEARHSAFLNRLLGLAGTRGLAPYLHWAG